MLFHLFARPTASWDPFRPTGGFLSLDVFYVLSGYLITSLIVAEYDRSGRVDLGAFYVRRVLRLFPALAVLVVVAGGAALIWHRQPWASLTLSGLPFVALYVGNWRAIFHGGSLPLGALDHTWSLSIEEQFYLIWPLLLLLVLRRRPRRHRVALALLGIAALEMIYRAGAVLALGWSARDRVYLGTDTHSDGLLLGCALAFLLASDTGRQAVGRLARPLRLIGWAAVCCLVASAMRLSYAVASSVWVGIPVASACTCLIVLQLATGQQKLLRSVLEWRLVQWVGLRSYGLFLWQNSLYVLVSGVPRHSVSQEASNVAIFFASFAVAAGSYSFVERPFLALKSRRSRHGSTAISLNQ